MLAVLMPRLQTNLKGHDSQAVINQPTTTVIKTQSETQIIHDAGIRAAVEGMLTSCTVGSILMKLASCLLNSGPKACATRVILVKSDVIVEDCGNSDTATIAPNFCPPWSHTASLETS